MPFLFSLFYRKKDFYMTPDELAHSTEGGVAIIMNTRVLDIDVNNKFLALSSGQFVLYEKLLLATGLGSSTFFYS